MEYVIEGGGVYRYSILVGANSRGEEDYGVKILRPKDGKAAQAVHLTSSIPKIDALAEKLMVGQVGPEELDAAIAHWKPTS